MGLFDRKKKKDQALPVVGTDTPVPEIVVPPSPITDPPPPVEPERKSVLMQCCVDCKRMDVTLYNINYKGIKRKACEKHRGRYQKWIKGSMGFNESVQVHRLS